MSFPANTIGLAADAAALRQEAVMGHAIPRQQPAVVLRSHFNQLRALLAIALVAVAGLTTAVVILANDSNEVSGTSSAKPIESINYGAGAVNPSTGYPSTTIRPDSPGTRYDGGPEEGTRGLGLGGALGARYDGGPEEGSADVTPAQPKVTQQQAVPGLAGHPSTGSATETKDEAASAAAIGQSTDGTVTRGSKTDPHGPASLLP
jgi:hypothetical protein